MNTELETEQEQSVEECSQCGSEIDESDSLGVEIDGEWVEVCGSCYDAHTNTCQICDRDDVMESELSGYILCKAELASIPGIYRILSRPFLSIPLIGSGHLHEGDVLFIDKLPKRDRHYEISGHICEKCARPYHRIYVQAFKPVPWMMRRYAAAYRGCKTKRAKWHAIMKYKRAGWAVVKQHVRNTILSNPDMLRDLECDTLDADEDGHHLSRADASAWRDLKARFHLPDLPTYHEWVFVEHFGVKVYYAGYIGADSWMTWHPEPCYRSNGHGPDVFSVGSLPNAEKHRAAYVTKSALSLQETMRCFENKEVEYWRKRQIRDGVTTPDDLDYWRERVSHYDTEPAIARAVTREAIELGFIRQDGTYNAASERMNCR